MAHALGMQRLDLYLQFDRELTAAELDEIRALIRRRGDDEPVAYLVGEREFHSLPFQVDGRVLVPRPETEHLVQVALAALSDEAMDEDAIQNDEPVFCDVGTGSGCVAIALLSEMPGARALATDVSADALAVARANAEQNEVSERLELLPGDLLAPLQGRPEYGTLDAVVSNPPYIVRGDESVQAGVDAHEPAVALYVAGDDPLEIVRRLATEARPALAPGGLLAVEVGFGAAAEAARVFEEAGYEAVEITKDLGGIERIVSGRRTV